MTFQDPRETNLTIEQISSRIVGFMQPNPQKLYRLIIGSDSQIRRVRSKLECTFVTAIVVHRVGEGAQCFWSSETIDRAPGLREKIYSETYRSLETANLLVPNLREVTEELLFDLEIHVDVGTRGATRELIKEIVGVVTGSGFSVKTKPESWVASSVADKHT